MNHFKIVKFFILGIVFLSTHSFSQDTTSVPVVLQLNDRGIADYRSIFVADFDFLNVGAVEDLFEIEINKRVGEVNVMFINIELVQNNNQTLATILTNGFQIPSNQTRWAISNRDIETTIGVNDSNLDPNASDLQDEIVATSQIPVGLYTLKSSMQYTYTDPKTQETSTHTAVTAVTANIQIIVTNPTLINLITPGVLLNSGFTYDIYSEQPILQWNGNSGEYQVLVFKKQSEFSTVEDILNSQPIWESERISTLSVQYPDFNALPLEFGKTYVWLVRSFINTSSGENALNSEPWEFTLVDPSQALGMQNMAKQELEQLLKQLLGNNADTIIRQLDGYGLSTIRVNGSTISTQELYQYIEKYRNQEKEIYDLTIRSSN
ncbi:MAG: hypothetical protein D8M58_10640 [Calditrichaeota bacterium]|nr:MAG: hypothetical protein DWQ03_10015 [Calditrichota bacterium]MBL1205848.1 hypothetical protein [Calditrichota bacterium]NOG45675.1 hypothetical protein [Calditrichota bacterium]